MHGIAKSKFMRPHRPAYIQAYVKAEEFLGALLPRAALALASDIAGQVDDDVGMASSADAIALIERAGEFIAVLKLERVALMKHEEATTVFDHIRRARAFVQRETLTALGILEARLAETPAPRWDAAVIMFADILASACGDGEEAAASAKTLKEFATLRKAELEGTMT